MAKCLKPALPFLDQEYTELLTEVPHDTMVDMLASTCDLCRGDSLMLAMYCCSTTMEEWSMLVCTST